MFKVHEGFKLNHCSHWQTDNRHSLICSKFMKGPNHCGLWQTDNIVEHFTPGTCTWGSNLGVYCWYVYDMWS